MPITTDDVAGYRPGVWKLDSAHSEIGFSVRHLAISKVRGTFERFEVLIDAPEDPNAISVEASIEVASVNTKQSVRDNHLRTSDFFAVDEFPTMNFVSSAFYADPDRTFRLEGSLTLRGVTRPVVLTGDLGGIAIDGRGQVKAGIEAKAKIDRRDFGVNWAPATEAGGVTLGHEISINFDLQFILG